MTLNNKSTNIFHVFRSHSTIMAEALAEATNDISALTIRSVSGSVSGAGPSPSQYVKLNVGGSLHYTTIATLTKHDNMLRAMFSGRMEVLTDADGWILLGRNKFIK